MLTEYNVFVPVVVNKKHAVWNIGCGTPDGHHRRPAGPGTIQHKPAAVSYSGI